MPDTKAGTALCKLKEELNALGISLPLSENLGVLSTPVTVHGKKIPNRLGVQPMEGCDGCTDGAPDELTRRRYIRFAKGGAGLIWFEATAVVPEARANPRQLYITDDNLDSFKRIVAEIKETGLRENGYEPYIVCQLTHSGRYSKPEGFPAPIIIYNNPVFEKDKPIDSARIASDEYLRGLPEHFGKAAQLAECAGFDAADIKCCHRYLMSELMSAYNREGDFGGDLENRIRLYFSAIDCAQKSTSDSFLITSRLNIYDGFAYPYGFGVKRDGSLTPDMTEPREVVRRLSKQFELLDITIGNPYVNPHVNRPFGKGPYEPPESPLTGVARMFELTRQIRSYAGDMKLMSSAHTYLRELSPFLAAGAIESGVSDIAGFGRMAFAYPDFANDILKNGELNPKKCCLTCSKCTELMRAGSVTGCALRDLEYTERLNRMNADRKAGK